MDHSSSAPDNRVRWEHLACLSTQIVLDVLGQKPEDSVHTFAGPFGCDISKEQARDYLLKHGARLAVEGSRVRDLGHDIVTIDEYGHLIALEMSVTAEMMAPPANRRPTSLEPDESMSP